MVAMSCVPLPLARALRAFDAGFPCALCALSVLPKSTEIGDRLRLWRQALGLTQAALAACTGIPIGVLKKYERAVSVPGGEALAAIARTGVNMTWLLTGEGEMWPPKPDPAPSAEASPALGRYARRLERIARLLEDMPDDRAESLLAEYLSRAQDVADTQAIRRDLAELRAALRRSR